MVYALVGLGLLALGQDAALLYLWKKLRAANDETAVTGAIANGLTAQLDTAYADLRGARAALVTRNKVEHTNDIKVVIAAPDLGAAIARINGLQPTVASPATTAPTAL